MSNESKATFFINDGVGLGQYVDPGISLGDLLKNKNVSLGDWQVKVNSQSVSANYIIQAGDRVSVLPTKMQGA